jgi:hypothetical protein
VLQEDAAKWLSGEGGDLGDHVGGGGERVATSSLNFDLAALGIVAD